MNGMAHLTFLFLKVSIFKMLLKLWLHTLVITFYCELTLIIFEFFAFKNDFCDALLNMLLDFALINLNVTGRTLNDNLVVKLHQNTIRALYIRRRFAVGTLKATRFRALLPLLDAVITEKFLAIWTFSRLTNYTHADNTIEIIFDFIFWG